jgi:hypothetical protein
LFAISTIQRVEVEAANRFCAEFENVLRAKAFSPLRVIKIADSSQTRYKYQNMLIK